MGFFSGLCDFVGSAISAVGSALGSVVGTIGGWASNLLKVASPWLGWTMEVVKWAGRFMNVMKPDDNIEELGQKALDADKMPEDFDSNATYIDYLRHEVQLDREKFKKAGTTEKLARQATGVAVVAKGIEEKKDMTIDLSTWVAMGKLASEQQLQHKEQEVDALLEAFKKGEISQADFADYVEGKLDEQKELTVGDRLIEVLEPLDPSATPQDLEDKVGRMVVLNSTPTEKN